MISGAPSHIDAGGSAPKIVRSYSVAQISAL